MTAIKKIGFIKHKRISFLKGRPQICTGLSWRRNNCTFFTKKCKQHGNNQFLFFQLSLLIAVKQLFLKRL